MEKTGNMKNSCVNALICLGTLLILSGCENESAPPTRPAQIIPATETDQALDAATLAVWQQGSKSLTETAANAEELCQSVNNLLDNPTEEKLKTARHSWHKTHNAYQGISIFLALPITNPGLFGSLNKLHFPLDAWPIQPGYLDAFDVYTHSGIVNDISVPITATAIRSQHGFSDVTDVSIGLHAIAYLLWSDNHNRVAEDFKRVESPQKKPAVKGAQIQGTVEHSSAEFGFPSHSDKTAGQHTLRDVDLPGNRRRALLTLQCNLLVDDLNNFHQHWDNSTSKLARHYLTLLPRSRLQLLQKALGHLITENLLAMQITPLIMQTEHSRDLDEIIHNRYAGQSATAMAAALTHLEHLLLNTEYGLAAWLPGEQMEEQLKHNFASAQQVLSSSTDLGEQEKNQLLILQSALQGLAQSLTQDPAISPPG